MKKYQFLLLISPILIGITTYLLGFNALYGQDSHEYLRQSSVIFDRFHGIVAPSKSLGDEGFPSGFPLLGAIFRLILRNPIFSLAFATWFSAGMSLFLFDLNLQKYSAGSALKSRLYCVAVLGFAPVFFTSSLVSMADMSALMCVLAMLYFAQNVLEKNQKSLFTAAFGAAAMLMRFAMAGLVLPMSLALTWHLWKQKKYWIWLSAIVVGSAVLSLHLWLKINANWLPIHHGITQGWSLFNLFERNFMNSDGINSYFLPNGLFVLSALMHPKYCLLLPAILFMAKKTDLITTEKKVLLFCLIGYLLLIGGTTAQAIRFLLPAYAIILILLFPAIDRFISYGFTYFKKYTYFGLILIYGSQFFFCIKSCIPLVQRNQEEQKMALQISKHLKSNQTLYGFDWDVSLKTYLPNLKHRNLWERLIGEYEIGSFIIFNAPALEKQWAKENPMLNWHHLNRNYRLKQIENLPKGWILYQIEEKNE
jgi:hypothetical protein